jgi:hypothetical protein
LKRRNLSYAFALLVLVMAPALADSYPAEQVPWSARLYGSEVGGGFVFLPAIDAHTMEPLRFAFSFNPLGDAGSTEGSLNQPGSFADAYGRYSQVFGSGAFNFMVMVEPEPFMPVFTIPYPQVWPVQYFEAGEAPEWDPDNLPDLVEFWIEEETLTGGGIGDGIYDEWDPEAIPEEAIQAAQAVSVEQAWQQWVNSPGAGDPLLLLDANLDLSTPEPSTFILVGGGIALAAAVRYRRRARKTT